MAYVYCRPHPDTIRPSMRFVVRTNRGVHLGGGKDFAQGEEFPADAVNARWLKMLYEQMKIDLFEGSGEAHAPDQAVPSTEPKVSVDLDQLSRADLAKLCVKYGLSTDGSKADLKARLLAPVV